MDRSNYWMRRSATRRRLLQAGAALGVGTAGLTLVGCGGDDDDGPATVQLATPTPAAGTAAPADPFAGAKRGGTYVVALAGDPPTLDPYGNLSFLTKGFAAYHYSRLFRYKTGPGIPYGSVTPIPDLAEKAEPSPDGLKWTVTLRDAAYHNIAPVNGRIVNTDDLRFSWGRLTAPTTQNRSQVAHVDKVEYPDAKTAVFTLKSPRAAFLDDLADANLLFVMPKEAEGGFDPQKTAIGTGPWIFESYKPAVKFVRKRNPEWMHKGAQGFPFFDAIENPIIPEYSNRKAQFMVGNLDQLDTNAEDLVELKKLISNVQFEGTPGPTLSHLYFDPDANSPWNRDPRVRHAISMALDRESLMEIGYNVKALRTAGLDVQTSFHNIIPAGETRWWVNPLDEKSQGLSARYFKYDLAEAKKLLAAAGIGDITVTYQYTANRYGKLFNDIAEAQISMINALGIKTTTEVQDYSSKYITQTFAGNFRGIAFGYETPFPEVGSYFTRLFGDDPLNHSRITDPKLRELAAKQSTQMNEEERRQTIKEIQQYHGEKMYYVPSAAGAGTGWTSHQPGIAGLPFVTKGYGAPTESFVYRWKA